GMVIAISSEDVRRGLWREMSVLWRLWTNARKSNILLSFVTSRGLREREPNLVGSCAIVIPSVCVIDPVAFVQSLKIDSEAAGATFAFNNRVVGIDEEAGTYIVTTDRQKIRTACLINAAGLYADDIASLALRAKQYTIHPLRGEYYELTSRDNKRLIGGLVYPALPAHATGKGIHFGPRPNGQVFIGPNEVAVQDKTDYTSRKTTPAMFIDALQKFIPALEERDLRWAYSGIRPCVSNGRGRKSDFIVSVDREDPPVINLIGIESPGLSAAMAIARHVADLPCIQTRFHPTGSTSSSSGS
ncbi:MAG TPA: FAD-dependent oxidoreductase, partial [Nitrospira sp.]